MTDVLPQMVALSEAYFQVYARREDGPPAAGAGAGKQQQQQPAPGKEAADAPAAMEA